RTLIAQLTPLPGSNCSTVFAKDNSPWGVSVSRTKLSLQSGMQYSPRSLYSSTGLVAPPRTYLHQSRGEYAHSSFFDLFSVPADFSICLRIASALSTSCSSAASFLVFGRA